MANTKRKNTSIRLEVKLSHYGLGRARLPAVPPRAPGCRNLGRGCFDFARHDKPSSTVTLSFHSLRQCSFVMFMLSAATMSAQRSSLRSRSIPTLTHLHPSLLEGDSNCCYSCSPVRDVCLGCLVLRAAQLLFSPVRTFGDGNVFIGGKLVE